MKPWFTVKAAAKDTEPVEILIHDQIGKDYWTGDGVASKEFAEALKEIPKDKEIVVGINSPGGNVYDGLAIYNLLHAIRDRVVTRIDGIAASMASVVALAGRELRMPKSALLMIHNTWSLLVGNADEMEKAAKDLRKHDETLVDIYAEASGQEPGKIRALMAYETWFTGPEALAFGFVDALTDETPAVATFDLSRFRHVPSALSPQPTQLPTAALHNAGKAPERKTMSAKLTALLTKHGVTPPEGATEDQLAELVEQQITKERNARLDVELREICAERPNVEFADWADKVHADATILDTLRKIKTVGSAPTRPPVSDQGNPLIEEYRSLKDPVGVISLENAKKRIAFRSANGQLVKEALINPMASNTIDSSLVTQVLFDAVQVVVSSKLAMLNAFTLDFSTRPMAPLTTYQVPINTAGPSVQTDATDFESGNSTLDNRPVTVHQLTASYHITNAQLQAGHSIDKLAGMAAVNLAYAVSDVVTALMVAGSDATDGYGTATAIGAAASFSASDLAAVHALAKNYTTKALLLDGGHIGYLMPTNQTDFALGQRGAFGFDQIYAQNRWTSATTNACGFVCQPNAILCIAGLPEKVPNFGAVLQSSSSTLEQGLSLAAYQWLKTGAREWWASLDLIFGAGVGDGTAGEVLVTS